MLEELHIRDVALIRDTWIEPSPGFTVFTGETGAGKTVLLNALKLIIGERGDLSLIRHGADAARIEAQFSGDILATRRLGVNGRNRCTLNDELVTVGRLAEALGPLIDLHGQHDHQALLRPATHGALLDAWGSSQLDAFKASYTEAFDRYAHAQSHLEELVATIEKSSEEIEAGRIALADIEQIDPQPQEDEQLSDILPVLQHAGELDEAIAVALNALRGEQAVLDLLAKARDAISAVSSYDRRLCAISDSLQRAAIEVDEASIALRDIRDGLEHDGQRLDQVLDRLGALDGLKKRFGPTLERVIERRTYLKGLLEVTEDSDQQRADAQTLLAVSKEALEKAAHALHEARVAAAHELSKELRAGVVSLDMVDASFDIACELLPFERFNASGPDRIEIHYRPSQNSTFRSLSKIASGGEISRVMLALKGVLGDADDAQTLVFDEIDAGIGGATATLVGRRLAHLARTHQVIVVTHLAQVAVFADTHYIVEKSSTPSGDVETSVARVDEHQRVDEIARMLAGAVTDTAREHARELFENASV